MAKKYTGIYARTLTMADFDTTAYDGIAIVDGVPVTLSYRVLPGNEMAFGSGSNSLGGVRTAKVFQIAPKDGAQTPNAVPCSFRLIYQDANKVRATVIREDLTSNVSGAVTTANQFNYIPETAGMRVGAYSYLTIQLTPLATSSGNSFSAANTTIQMPVTNYTLVNSSGN